MSKRCPNFIRFLSKTKNGKKTEACIKHQSRVPVTSVNRLVFRYKQGLGPCSKPPVYLSLVLPLIAQPEVTTQEEMVLSVRLTNFSFPLFGDFSRDGILQARSILVWRWLAFTVHSEEWLLASERPFFPARNSVRRCAIVIFGIPRRSLVPERLAIWRPQIHFTVAFVPCPPHHRQQ